MNSKIGRKIKCQIASSKSKKTDDLKEDINKQVNSTGHWDNYNTVQEHNDWGANKNPIYNKDLVTKNSKPKKKLRFWVRGSSDRNVLNKKKIKKLPIKIQWKVTPAVLTKQKIEYQA